MKIVKMIGWIFLAVTIVIVAIVCLQVDDWSRDWTQNEAAMPVVKINTSPDEVLSCLQKWADANGSWAVVSQESNDTIGKMHLTHTTGFLKFVDDVHVDITSNGSTVEVAANSKSRVGKGDLGQNPRNLKKLSAALVPLCKRVGH